MQKRSAAQPLPRAYWEKSLELLAEEGPSGSGTPSLPAGRPCLRPPASHPRAVASPTGNSEPLWVSVPRPPEIVTPRPRTTPAAAPASSPRRTAAQGRGPTRRDERKAGQRALPGTRPIRACDGSERCQAGCAAKPRSTAFPRAPSRSGHQGGSLAATSEQVSPRLLGDTTLETGMSHPDLPSQRIDARGAPGYSDKRSFQTEGL